VLNEKFHIEQVEQHNVATETWYSRIQREFRMEFAATPELLRTAYDNKPVQAVYTGEEIKKFKRMWRA